MELIAAAELVELVVEATELVELAVLLEELTMLELDELAELDELEELGELLCELVPEITTSPTETVGGSFCVCLHPEIPVQANRSAAAANNFEIFIRQLRWFNGFPRLGRGNVNFKRSQSHP